MAAIKSRIPVQRGYARNVFTAASLIIISFPVPPIRACAAQRLEREALCF